MSRADLRLVLLLVLLVFTTTIFATCRDAPSPVAPDALPPNFARKCDEPPCGNPGGNKDNKGEQKAWNFSMQFDGGQFAETGDSDLLDLANTFTIEGWIKPFAAQGSDEYQGIIEKWRFVTADDSYSVALGSPSDNYGKLGLTTLSPGPVVTKLWSSQPLQDNLWVHFAFVFDNGQASLYLDGVLDVQRNGMTPPQATTAPLDIGLARVSGTTPRDEFSGVLDEIRLWNVARSAKQIEKNYEKEISTKSKGLIAYWKMNEGRGQVLVDATSNGHDMQLGNSPDADTADPTRALKWEAIASLPVAVFQAAGATDGLKAYSLGGNEGPVGPCCPFSFPHSAENQVYDPAAASWSSGTQLPSARSFAMAATLADGIHIVGGRGTVGGVDVTLDLHDVFDPSANTWSSSTPLSTAAHAGVAEAVGNKLFVITASGHQIYDPATAGWSSGASRPISAIQTTSAVIDGEIYVAGGSCCGGSTTFDALHRYDPATDSWETLAHLPATRSALGGGAIGGQFCVFGGRLADPSPTGDAFADTFCYDPTTDTWSSGPDMITPRVEMASVESRVAVYALAGRTPTAYKNTTAERLVPDTPFP